MRYNKYNYLILTILPAVLLFTSCKNKTASDEGDKPFVISDSLLHTLTIDSVQSLPIIYDLTFSGQVTFNEDKVARIYPPVSGNVTDVKVLEGDFVNRGQTLGVIRSMEMTDYGNEVVNAKTNLLMAKKNLDASQEMARSGLISDKDLFSAKQMYNQTEAQLQRANEILKINGGNMKGEYFLRSPISGFVVDKKVNNDMVIRSDNGTDLFTISDLKDVWVLANVYESNIGEVHLGDPVVISTLSYPDKTFTGKIDKILNVLDENNKVMKVRVVLPNPGYLLKPRMFASVTMINRTNEKAMSVPAASVLFIDNQHYVLKYISSSNVQITPVGIISKHGDRTFVSGNLNDGDKIIGSNTLLIYSALNS